MFKKFIIFNIIFMVGLGLFYMWSHYKTDSIIGVVLWGFNTLIIIVSKILIILVVDKSSKK